MDVLKRGLAAASFAVLGSAPGAWGQATSLETDWMELVKGYRGQKSGVEMRDIRLSDDASGGQSVTLAIPKSAIGHPDEMEEVRVVGRRPESMEFEFPLEFTYEWVDNYDNDYYGLVIHLGKDSKVPFRLFMDSRSGYTQ